MKLHRLSILFYSALALWAPCGFAQTSTVPTLLSYQGLLSDSAGNLIGATTPVNRTVQFRLYNTSSNGTPIWAESQVVTISAGEFSVLIGNGAGISGLSGPSAPAVQPFTSLADAVNASASAALFLGLTVDDGNAATTDLEVSPRQQLVAGMFALRAKVAESVANGGITSGMIADFQVSTNALQTSAVTTAKLADSSITSAKIANGAILAVDLSSAAVTADKIDTNTVGLWSVAGANLYRPSGNVGIGTTGPGYPLSFPEQLGDKISLWGQSGAHLGFGIQPSALQIYGANVNDDVVFGYGSSFALTEVMRVKGNGNVGIGTSTPAYPLSFPNTLGDKITLWGQSGNHYGFGIQGGLLQIFTDGGGADVAFGFGNSGSFNETMRVKGNGRVGIGTNNPQGGLHVYEPNGSSGGPTAGAITVEHGDNYGASSIVFPSRANYGSDFGYVQYLDNRNYHQGGESARMVIGTSNDGDDHVILNPSGFVGIKTYDPIAPLHVASGGYTSFFLDAYFDGYAGRDANFNTTQYHSIVSDNRVRASAFDVNSDSRIKTDQSPSDGEKDLATLRQIKITDYRHIDVVGEGRRPQKKVIAQQVEAVFAQAISKGRGAIPDIYKKASVKDGWVNLATNLKPGEKVRLVTKKEAVPFEVLEVTADKFLTAMEGDAEEVFVFGREVDDLRSVDYDAIAMLNVSATQALLQRQESEHAENLALKKTVVGLQENVATLAARLAALEKLVGASK